MTQHDGLSYAAAGVDIEAYTRMLERARPLIAATHGPEVVTGIGPFAGLYALPGGGHLAASADGVGTKIKVAIAYGRHRVGEPLVLLGHVGASTPFPGVPMKSRWLGLRIS